MTDVAPLGRVVVLMSTYNGERYLPEQLRSVLDQLPLDGVLMIRDDGSTDGTETTIRGFADERIVFTQGQNLGFGQSFLTLLQHAPADADMVMFADQDDVWLPHKIERAWRHLRGLDDRPALYGATQMLVNARLERLHPTATWSRGPSFTNALTENIITGCTAALNRPALRLLQAAGVPRGVYFHDWWLYLVVSAFGCVVYDNEPALLYRQHGGNQIGHGAGRLGRQWQIARFLLRHDWVGILLGQVSALMNCYGRDLPEPARRLVLEYFLSVDGRVRPRWRLMLSLRRWRQTAIGEVALRVLLALHQLRLWPRPARRLA